ncbi:MAG: type III secretion system export apparatus subunit SctT [Betaproteobacteria bacterium]|nr:type III secretion system export apparatus subunit SctT [Betaproteobacteria bacterium]
MTVDPNYFGTFLLCMPRIMAVLFFLPFTRNQFLPTPVRSALLVSLAIFIAPAAHDPAFPIDSSDLFFMIALKELAIGVMMGLVMATVFFIPQLIGDFIDNQRGASIAQIYNPSAGGEASILGSTLNMLVATLFLIGGGFVALLDIIFNSYQIIGIPQMLPADVTERAYARFVDIFSGLITIGVLLAAPIVFTMMLAEFGLGLVGRFVQQLQVFFLAMPIKSVIALALMIVYITVLIRIYTDHGLPFEPLRQLIDALADG